jgi:hypothetical protein
MQMIIAAASTCFAALSKEDDELRKPELQQAQHSLVAVACVTSTAAC